MKWGLVFLGLFFFGCAEVPKQVSEPTNTVEPSNFNSESTSMEETKVTSPRGLFQSCSYGKVQKDLELSLDSKTRVPCYVKWGGKVVYTVRKDPDKCEACYEKMLNTVTRKGYVCSKITDHKG